MFNNNWGLRNNFFFKKKDIKALKTEFETFFLYLNGHLGSLLK